MTNKVKVLIIVSICVTIISSALFVFLLREYNREKTIWTHLSENEMYFLLREEDGVYNNVEDYTMSATDYSIWYYLVTNENEDNLEIYTKTTGKKDYWYMIRSGADSEVDEEEYVIFNVLTFTTKMVTKKEFSKAIKRETGLNYSEDDEDTIEPLHVENYID
ncbi:hypothetical protein [Enterococcus sp. BWR-S5]|uniref:hypothetical protein n=1 Tax=Enterococcus sp. BWR-S5 TaxID=2787714 RepID=UPI00192189B5|nr:hypothetical protein [Enterococcus sp. BWR-S5]MBL1224137.1 hypothetical protein [Enterococcus sp. BWR-S5]